MVTLYNAMVRFDARNCGGNWSNGYQTDIFDDLLYWNSMDIHFGDKEKIAIFVYIHKQKNSKNLKYIL